MAETEVVAMEFMETGNLHQLKSSNLIINTPDMLKAAQHK
jgi:hypothetical protein